MNRNLLVGATLLVLVGVFAFGAQQYRGQRAAESVALSEADAAVFTPPHAIRYGAPDAKVVIVEWFDPACETCAAFSPIVKEMVDKNPGRVQLVLRYAPLHQGSDAVVAILEASRNQDRYWDTLELLFSAQHIWTEHHAVVLDRVWPVLEQGGLDVARLRTEMNDAGIARIIAQDVADAKKVGVTKTPGYFVNGRPLEPFGKDPLIALVQAEYQKMYR